MKIRNFTSNIATLFSSHRKEIAILLLIWLVATAFNITKPVHVDDASYVDMARAVLRDPLHPLRTEAYKLDRIDTMKTRMHPLGLTYINAGVIAAVGESEFALHLVQSFFTLGCVVFFYLIALHFTKVYAMHLTALFVLSPGFIPSQNLMLDIPQFCFWLIFLWGLLEDQKSKIKNKLIIAGLAAGAAILVKYSGLVLIPLFFLILILQRRWRYLWTGLIPVLILALWSLWNYFDVGIIHFLSNERPQMHFDLGAIRYRWILWTLALGSIAPFSILVLPYFLRRVWGALLIAGIIFFAMVYSGVHWIIPDVYWPPEQPSSYALRVYFFANGLFLYGVMLHFSVVTFFDWWRKRSTAQLSSNVILLLWMLATGIFVFLITSAVAVRYAFVSIPAILLMLPQYLGDRFAKRLVLFALAGTIALGCLLGISDWLHANIYRTQMYSLHKEIPLQKGKKIWFLGAFDMLHYGRQSGMYSYDPGRGDVFSQGDYVVLPRVMLTSAFTKGEFERLDPIKTIRIDSTPLTFFRLSVDWPYSLAGYYSFFLEYQLPWGISTQPLEEFDIYEVKT